jgi:hypothetical protein
MRIVFSILFSEIEADALVWVIGFKLNKPFLSLFLKIAVKPTIEQETKDTIKNTK